MLVVLTHIMDMAKTLFPVFHLLRDYFPKNPILVPVTIPEAMGEHKGLHFTCVLVNVFFINIVINIYKHSVASRYIDPNRHGLLLRDVDSFSIQSRNFICVSVNNLFFHFASIFLVCHIILKCSSPFSEYTVLTFYVFLCIALLFAPFQDICHVSCLTSQHTFCYFLFVNLVEFRF